MRTSHAPGLGRLAPTETHATTSAMRELLTERHVAGVLRVSIKTLQAWRLRGGGPPFIKLGRCVRYRLEDLEAFVASARRHSTSDVVRNPGVRRSEPILRPPGGPPDSTEAGPVAGAYATPTRAPVVPPARSFSPDRPTTSAPPRARRPLTAHH